jgi:hypothetical protein
MSVDVLIDHNEPRPSLPVEVRGYIEAIEADGQSVHFILKCAGDYDRIAEQVRRAYPNAFVSFVSVTDAVGSLAEA